MKKITLILISIFFILSLCGCGVVQRDNLSNDELTKIAKCLTDKGVKMYGANWCAHCKKQKEDFKEAFQYIDYTECDPSTDTKQAKECVKRGIENIPAWEFPDGTVKTGEVQPSELAKIAGC
ncbi:hypothetical protein J7J83_01830 [bacterium]|nr:hypothetical protein [bacterium]